MKKWIYAIGLALLPAIYIVLMRVTEQPVDWRVLVFMAFIVLTILLCAKPLGRVEKKFNALSDKEKLKVVGKAAAKVAIRSVGKE